MSIYRKLIEDRYDRDRPELGKLIDETSGENRREMLRAMAEPRQDTIDALARYYSGEWRKPLLTGHPSKDDDA